MAREKISRSLFFALFSLMLLPFSAEALTGSIGEIELGSWNANFSKGKKYAEAYHVPMVLVYTSPTCSNCALLKSELDAENVETWASERQMVMILDSAGGEALEFARNNSGELPYVCVYWPKSDGSATTNRFSGLNGKMPVTSGTLAQQFMDSCDFYTKDWAGVYRGAEFKVGDYEGNRLEAVVGKTTYTEVPLIRSALYSSMDATSLLLANFPGSEAIVTNEVAWASGEIEKIVRIVFPAEYLPRKDDRVELSLSDAGGSGAQTSSITLVSASESGLNIRDPLWIGEEFAFGRFTFDYDAATNAVAAKRLKGEKAYTLAFFTGTLWCPYCLGMEGSLLSSPSFYEWAAANNVALVVFDQGLASKPATAEGTRAPRLLTYEPNPNKPANATVSGAGYLSRHSIPVEDAERAIARITHYTAKWLAPETTAARMSQPTFLLIEDDAVKARFAAYRDNSRVYDVQENIGRLQDLLLLSEGNGESRGYRTTTTLEHQMGETTDVSFQISDKTAWYGIGGVCPGQLTFVNNGDESLVFDLYRDGQTVAVGTNDLEWSSTTGGGDFNLRVRAYTATRLLFKDEGKLTSVFNTSFTSTLTLIPGEASATCGNAGTYNVEIAAGETYRFVGFTDGSLSDFEVVDAEKGLYRAVYGGTLAMTAASSGATYQLWRPGVVSFATTVITIPESETNIMLKVSRSGGGSNAARVMVQLDDESKDHVPPEKYTWKDVELTWLDGEKGDLEIPLAIHADYVDDGVQTLGFTLVLLDGDGVEIADDTCSVFITETQAAMPGVFKLAATEPAFAAKTIVLAEEGSVFTMTVARLQGSDGAASVNIVPSYGGLDPVRLEWSDHDRTSAKSVSFTLPGMGVVEGDEIAFEFADSTLPFASGRPKVTVRLFAKATPTFAEDIAEFHFVKGVAGEATLGLKNVSAQDTLRVLKVSGVLPSGLSASVDATKGFFVAGTPKLCGEWECTYRIARTLEDGSELFGGVVRVKITIADAIVDAIPALGEPISLTTIPVYDAGLDRVTGLISLALTSSGRLSAKYKCAAGVQSLSCSSWESFDMANGIARASLESRDARYRMTLEIDADGAIRGTLVDPAFIYDELSFATDAGARWSAEETAEAWQGLYTAAFIPSERLSGGEAVAPTGCSAFSLRMSKSAANAGRMLYAGRLPNGRTVSGTSVLAVDAGGKTATLPIYLRSTTDVFSGALSIAAGAAEAYASNHVHRAITASSRFKSVWTHTEAKTEQGDFAMAYDAVGSYYDPDEDLASCLASTDVSSTVALTFHAEELASSQDYGEAEVVAPAVTTVAAHSIRVAGGSASLSFNRSKGVVSGRVVLPFAASEAQAAYFGVVLPGWTGCGCVEGEIDLPFIMGALWFNDTLHYSLDCSSCNELVRPNRTTPIRRGCRVTAETTGLN